MNMPPTCKCSPERPAVWTVIDKTKSEVSHLCRECLLKIFQFETGHTYSVFPAKDYSKGGRQERKSLS